VPELHVSMVAIDLDSFVKFCYEFEDLRLQNLYKGDTTLHHTTGPNRSSEGAQN